MSDNKSTPDVTALGVKLLSAYLSNNQVATEDITVLFKSTKVACGC